MKARDYEVMLTWMPLVSPGPRAKRTGRYYCKVFHPVWELERYGNRQSIADHPATKKASPL